MAQPRRALGKGIGALIPSASPRRAENSSLPRAAAPEGELVQKLALAAIDVNPRQPRAHFEEADLQDLATSIEERGVLQPILVRPKPDGRYELVAGERRLRASQRAGRSEIPALVKAMSDDESLLIAIIENVQRADLDPLEEAQAYRALQEEFDLKQEEIARRVGKSRPTIANALRLLQLPESTQSQIRSGKLSAGHARALLGLDGTSEREALARRIVEGGLSVRETEKAVQQGRKPAAKSAPSPSNPDIRVMESDLSRALGTKVSIHASRGQQGRVEIRFYSDDDLARLVDLLRAAGTAPRIRPG